MHLLILAPAFAYMGNPGYHGTDRPPPAYREDMAPAHPVNRSWQWLAGLQSDGCGVENLERAREVVTAYHQLTPPEDVEIIEVTRGDAIAEVGEVFLGFDLSYGFGNSLISGGVTHDAVEARRYYEELPAQDATRTLSPLVRLMGAYLEPHLNSNRLIDNYDVARLWLECARAVQTLKPGFYEYGDYEVVGVWSVSAE